MPRYVIKEKVDKDEIREFSVALLGQNDYEAAGVWVSGDGIPRCASCSGPLTAMLASCSHARAVKRFLARESTNAK